MSTLSSGIEHGHKRPEDPFTIELFERPLTIGGEYEAFLAFPDDASFDTSDDDSVFISQYLSVELFYELSDSISFFADVGIFETDGQELGRQRVIGAERGQAWLLFEEIFNSNFDIKIGPQYFSDEREWWWDAVLDGISLQYWNDRWQAELGFTQQLARTSTTEDELDPYDEDLFRLLGRVSWEFANDHWMEFFYVAQNDHSSIERVGEIIDNDREDGTDADLQWFGVRISGYRGTDSLGAIDYWLDTGYVFGDETYIYSSEVDDISSRLIIDDVETFGVRGWAVDLGVTWETQMPLSPSFTVGYAVGSGELDEDGDLEYAYRQTGIQGNMGTFGDSSWLLYYGELLNPELSNLKIWTLGFGIPIFDDSSFNLFYHRYDQYKPADYLYWVGIDEEPSGINTHIGEEIDIIISVEEWIHWEFDFILAFFKAGDAFEEDSGEIISNLFVTLSYSF